MGSIASSINVLFWGVESSDYLKVLDAEHRRQMLDFSISKSEGV